MNLELLTRIDIAEKTGALPDNLAADIRQALLVNMPHSDRLLRRNHLYRQALDLLPGSPWQRAGHLAEIINRWTGRYSSDPIRQYLYEMKALGVRLLISQRKIYEVLTKN